MMDKATTVTDTKLCGERIQIKEIHVLLPFVWITPISECSPTCIFSSYIFFVWTIKTTPRGHRKALPYNHIWEMPFFRVSVFSINSWTGYETECFPMQFGWTYFVWIILFEGTQEGHHKLAIPAYSREYYFIHFLVCSKIKFCLLTFEVTFSEEKCWNPHACQVTSRSVFLCA